MFITFVLMNDNKPQNNQILQIIADYIEANPTQRFTQILANLHINSFANPRNPASEKFLLRDNYNDNNEEVLYRIQSQPDLKQ